MESGGRQHLQCFGRNSHIKWLVERHIAALKTAKRGNAGPRPPGPQAPMARRQPPTGPWNTRRRAAPGGRPTTASTPTSANRTPPQRERYPGRSRPIHGSTQKITPLARKNRAAMPRNAPTKPCTRQHRREPRAVEGWHRLVGGHERKRSAGGLGIPRNEDAPPIMRFGRLGNRVDNRSAYIQQYSGADGCSAMPSNSLSNARMRAYAPRECSAKSSNVRAR
jgi:hypothetical protein